MRTIPLLTCLALAGTAGCSGTPALRSDPVDAKVTVKLPSGSPKDLAVSFSPQGDGQPTGGKVGADGTLTVKAIPGKYTFHFPPEPNAAVAAYKQIPEKYRSANKDHTVELDSGSPAAVEVK